MAAGEDQLEPLVLDRRRRSISSMGARRASRAAASFGERPLAADPVDRAVAAGGHQPGAPGCRAARRGASARPRSRTPPGRRPRRARSRRGSRPGTRGRGPTRRRKTSSISSRLHGISTNGRTSTAPPSRTAGIRWANSSASSRLDGVEHVVAAEHLLGVGEGAVGDQRLAAGYDEPWSPSRPAADGRLRGSAGPRAAPSTRR